MFYGSQFFLKISQKLDTFSIFFQIFNVLRFKMVSNWIILNNFDQITLKIPFWQLFKNSTTPHLLFIAFSGKNIFRGRCFMGQKIDFKWLEPPFGPILSNISGKDCCEWRVTRTGIWGTFRDIWTLQMRYGTYCSYLEKLLMKLSLFFLCLAETKKSYVNVHFTSYKSLVASLKPKNYFIVCYFGHNGMEKIFASRPEWFLYFP